jgi:hypothetical protein
VEISRLHTDGGGVGAMCYGGLDARHLMREADRRLAGLPVKSLSDAPIKETPILGWQGKWAGLRAWFAVGSVVEELKR